MDVKHQGQSAHSSVRFWPIGDVPFARSALLSQPRSGCAPSAGQDGPLLYPGPLCGGEAGTTGRAAGADRDVGSLSPGQDALSKSPAPTHGLAGQARAWMPELRQRRSSCPMPGKRQAGWPFSLVTFSLATQRESDSVAAGDRPLLALNAARASRTGCAPAIAHESNSAAAGRRKLLLRLQATLQI